MIKARKLKIAIFHLAFIYSGGGEKLVLQEYDGLKKKGYDVSIFTTVINNKKSFPEIIKKYKIKTFLPNYRIFNGHEALKTILSCILAPFYAFKFKKYDVILACNQPSPWIAYIIKLIYKVPYVSYLAQPTRFLHQRDVDKKMGLFFAKKASESISARLMMTTFKRFSNWADKVSIKNSSKILVNGEYIANVIKKIYKVETILCPSGVLAPNKFVNKKGDYLLVTNRHFPQKRLEYAIFALNSILSIRPNYRLIITGMNTDYTQKLKNLVSELGITKSVEFRGYVDENKLKDLYKNATCYLYTAPEEDFGMGVIEAMSLGTPVVAWNTNGPSKIITNGVDGFLAKPYDISDFIKLIVRLIRDKKLSDKIILNAKRSVAEKYSLRNHVNTIANILNIVCLNKYA